jgi:hypothetical protein
VNHARIAHLLRSLADEFESESEVTPAPRRRLPLRSVKAPIQPPSELDRQRARQQLERRGYRVGGK